MLRNYFKIAWRNLMRHKFYAFISIIGLALGMSCSLLIALWVWDEMSYNCFYKDHEDIYLVRRNINFNGQLFTPPVTPGPLAETLKEGVPQVAYSVKLGWNRGYLVSVGENANKEDGLYATEDLFDVFPLPAVEGNPKAALASPSQIVISRELSRKYFGDRPAVGKTLRLTNAENDSRDYLIGAVIEDIPANSSLQFDWVVNFKETQEDWMENWGNNSFITYVRLTPNTTRSASEASMKDIYKRYARTGLASSYPILQPIKDVHLYTEYQNGIPVGGRIEYVRIFTVVAAFILLIACINFMNLATARSSLRSKEIGLRKVAGANRLSLIRQFMSESFLTSFLALGLAIVLVYALLPVFNRVFDKQIGLNLGDPPILLGIAGLLLLTGFLSGSYPALYLSALQPVRVLKNNLKFGFSAVFFRKALVVFQFTLSVFLIIGMVVISKQMQYTLTENLGLDRERLVYIPIEGEIVNKLEVFRQELIQSPAIASATTATHLPVNVQSTSGDLSWLGKDPNLQTDVSATQVGYDFIKTLNIQLLGGRDFSKEFSTDSAAYLINESAAKLMGMDNPVGQQIQFWHGKGPIIGLMKDFHFRDLHTPIGPLVLCLYPPESTSMLVKLEAGKVEKGIDELERITKAFNPNYPFEYHFTDEEYEQLYKSDMMTSTLIKYFGTLAVLISALGLLALAAFTAERRIKEIGIRKVLGASVSGVVVLLSRDFIKLVLIGIVLATPLAWYVMNKWLAGFAYRIDLEWWMFALAGLLAVVIALLTVSFQSVKAALTNPVKSLRSE